MIQRCVILCAVATVTLFHHLNAAAAAAADEKPNFVYIMSDELGYYEPGCMGGKNITTPNLDRMAAEGIRFNNLFAGSSVCAPTRCCFLTGKHSGHTSVRSNGGGTPLRAEEETIASILKPLGYVIHDAAIKFIRENVAAKKPFFAYLPYTPPHGNFDIPDDDPAWAIYKQQSWPEPARRYATMVSLVDRQVGEVLALLKELDIDGISFVPELIGEQTAGRKQAQHEYLYWDFGGWTAIRQGNWRAVKPPRANVWELYDLATDPSESQNVAAAQPQVLAELTALANQAHEPVREGTFASTDRHQRDRRAKFGRHDQPEASLASTVRRRGPGCSPGATCPSRKIRPLSVARTYAD